MKFIELQLKDVWPNPYRDIENYTLDEGKIEALMESITSTGFWNNVVGRILDTGEFEIAYGHHRLEAAIRVLGEDYVQAFPVVDLADYQMLQMMASENRDDWGNSTKHNNLTIHAGRDYLDGLLDKYPTWNEALTASEFRRHEIEAWFCDAQHYGRAVSEGVGNRILVKFFGWNKTDVEYALRQIDPSNKQLKLLKARKKEADKKHAEAVKERNEAGRVLKEGVIDAGLMQAELKQKSASDALDIAGHYDSKAGKLFNKPIHADAFRAAVTSPTLREFLPKKKQKAYAKKIIKHYEKAEDNMTAKAIKDYIFDDFSKARKGMDDTLEDIDPLFAYYNRIASTATAVKAADTSLIGLMEAMRDVEAGSLIGNDADRLIQNMRRNMARMYMFFERYGLELPELTVKSTTLKLIKG